MAQNRILLKKSSVVGKIPSTSDVEFGELALNFSDGRLYFKNSDNIVDFFQSGVSSSTLPFAANEGDFGSVTTVSESFSFDLGSLEESELFSHDLGNITPDTIDEIEESGDALALFVRDNDLGVVNDLNIENSFTLSALNELPSDSFDLGLVTLNGTFKPDRFILSSFTVATLPLGSAGEMAFVTDEVNGPAPAFFDGSAWKRLTDNQIVSPVFQQPYIEDGYVENEYI